MRTCSRRSLLATLGAAWPLGLGARADARPEIGLPGPTLRLRPFEAAVRAAFADRADSAGDRRIPVGDCDLLRAGVQGCHNDRPFAGFPAGGLRIVRVASEPAPAQHGVRLYVTTLELIATRDQAPGPASRPLDFAALPPAPELA